MARTVDRKNQPVLIGDAAPSAGAHRHLTILVIDDEEPIRLMIQDLLQLEGYTVLLAWNGKIGLECAQESHPDLILTDIMMPIMDGYELSRRLHADPQTAQIPIIAMSAAFQQRYAGLFSAVITKPFELLPLLALINTHLGGLAK